MTIYKKKQSICCRLDEKDLCHEVVSNGRENNPVCIYLLDKSNKCAFIYGCKEGFPKDLKKQLSENSIHINSHKKAFENKQVRYEWFLDGYVPILYKTLLVPFVQEDGSVDKVLGIVRGVPARLPGGKSFTVAEGDSPSIVRLMIKSREEEKRKLASLVHDEIGTAAVAINSLLAILKEDIKDGKIKTALTDADKLQKAVFLLHDFPLLFYCPHYSTSSPFCKLQIPEKYIAPRCTDTIKYPGGNSARILLWEFISFPWVL